MATQKFGPIGVPVSFQCPTINDHFSQRFNHYFTAGACTSFSGLDLEGNCGIEGCCNRTTCKRWYDYAELQCVSYDVYNVTAADHLGGPGESIIVFF